MSQYARSQLFCGLCKEYVIKSTFYRHKRRYYSVSDKTWQLAQATRLKANTTEASRSFEYFQDDLPFEDDFLESNLPKDQGKSTLFTAEVYSFLNGFNL